MGKENEIVVSDKTSDQSARFQEILKTTYNLLAQYVKDFKDPDSWVPSYSEALSIKFPSFTFNEGHAVFCDKVIKVLDLMEMSHLYCKVTNPPLYNEEAHQSVVATKKFVYSSFKEMKMAELEELRQHLKNYILYGNN